MMISTGPKGIYVSKLVAYVGLGGSCAVILVVGLLCGLVARPKNCIKSPIETTQFPTTIPTTITTTRTIPTTTTSYVTSGQQTSRTTSSTTRTLPPTTSTSTTTTTTTRTTTRTLPSTSASQTTTTTQVASTTTTTTTRTSTSTSTTTTVSTSTSTTTRTTTSTTRSTTTTTTTTAPPTSTTTSTSTATITSTLQTVTRTLPSTATLTTNPVFSTAPPDDIRLPNYLIPTNYNLELKVFFNPIGDDNSNDKFDGRVIIDLKLTNSSKKIILHMDESLKVMNNIQVENAQNGQTYQIGNDKYNYLQNQLFEINLDTELAAGDYKLKIEYTGNYGPATNIIGFYKTKYTEDGVTKNLVATKFQPTDARRAYPCFDEPALKASYEITIEHPMATLALSNWPEQPRESIAGNRFRTRFNKTDPMSSYLAAWTVLPDDFGFLESTTANGKKIRVFARKEAVDKGLIDFALEVTKKSLDFFENEYFEPSLRGVPPKVDSIGFPDFPSGAMEHWGIIGYRETSLLYSDDRNTLANKEDVAQTIAHEVSHFWFGNLVTCKWWDELWLNEAMATFLEFKAIQRLYPEWDIENQFLTNNQIPVMYDDGFGTSRPVQSVVLTPAQINSAFSSITYNKGCALLRMLESTVGAANFRQGLIDYLKANEFQAAVGADFYNSLKLPAEMSSVTPQQYVENWLLQINYPEVAVLMEEDSGVTKIVLKQARFLLSPEGSIGTDQISPFGYKWMIYLQCKAGGSIVSGQPDNLQGDIEEFNYFLKETDGSINLKRRYTWVKCNKDFKGYYVTDYTDSNFQALENVLVNQPTVFSVGDRSNLIHVAYTLAYLGSKSYATPAFLTNYLEAWERDLVPWRTFTWHMNKIATILEHRKGYIELQGFGIDIVRSLSSTIDIWDDKGSHEERLLKITLIDFLCRMQDEYCLKNATSQFENINPDYFTNPTVVQNNVAPNLRGLVMKYHLQNTYDYTDWFTVSDLYTLTIDPQERAQILSAIANTRLLWIIDIELYELLKLDSKIRAQDFFQLLTAISRNPSGRHLAWYFIRHYWYDLVNKFGAGSRTLANSVKNICLSFDSLFLYNEMLEFFGTTNPGGGELQRQQALDIVVHNIFWINDREPDIQQNLFLPFRLNKK